MKPISLQLYTLRERTKDDLFGTLRQVAEIGYKGVEPAGMQGHTPQEVAKVIADLGMTVSSMHGAPANAGNVSEIVETAGALGTTLVISGRGRDAFTSVDDIKRVAADFQASAELLKGHGIRMGYHNHWWELNKVDGRYGLDILMEQAPDLLCQIDIYWATNFGQVDTPALIARYAARTPTLHIKDGPLVEGQPHTAAGAGKMDIPACVAAADEKVLDWLIVELDQCATDMLHAVRDSYSYLTGAGLAAGNK